MKHSEQCFCDECLKGFPGKNTLFFEKNLECIVDFYSCVDDKGRGAIGLTIMDRETGRLLDIAFDKAALIAALSK